MSYIYRKFNVYFFMLMNLKVFEQQVYFTALLNHLHICTSDTGQKRMGASSMYWTAP